MESNEIMYCNQYSFRKNHSCQHAILKLTHDILDSLNKKNYTIATLIDLSKAFNTISHSTLFKKLHYYGFSESALNWFRSYFDQRAQQIKLNSQLSKMHYLNYGVGQGTCLGPLIFLLQINDLHSNLKYSKTISFADDTTIYLSDHNLVVARAHMNHDLRILSDWFKANKMSPNIDKINYMIFGDYRNTNIHLQIDDINIIREHNVKFLGIWIDDRLSWQMQIDTLCNKIRSSIYFIRSSKNILSTNLKKQLYYNLVYTYIIYGIETWGTMLSVKQIKHLQVQQNNALRAICNLKSCDSVEQCYRRLDILKINSIIKLYNMLLVYKHKFNLLPVSLNSIFLPNNYNHNYDTRHAKDPRVKTINDSLYQKSFICRAPSDWSQLPNNIKGKPSLKSFKKSLTSWLIDNQ